MTDTFTHHHLTIEPFTDKNGAAIMLSQQDSGLDDPKTIVVHPWQLRAACEHLGLIASDPQAQRTIATLTRRLKALRDRIDHLDDYLAKYSDHDHADLDYELTYITATMDIADEFCAGLDDLATVPDQKANPSPTTPAQAQPSLI